MLDEQHRAAHALNVRRQARIKPPNHLIILGIKRSLRGWKPDLVIPGFEARL
jgi:hypothetical protein